MIAAVVVAEERFGALVDPLHRPAEAPRRPQDENGLGIQEVLHAEAAAYVRRDDADTLRGHLERVREDAAGEVNVLARGVEQIASLALVVGAQRSARLDRTGDHPVIDEIEADHVFRRRQGGLGRRRIPNFPIVGEILSRAVPYRRGIAAQRRLGIDDGRQGFVFDGDEFGRIERLLPRPGDDECDSVAQIADTVRHQRVARWHEEGRPVRVGGARVRPNGQQSVGGGGGAREHRGDARSRLRRRGVDAADDRVGVRRPQNDAVERSVKGNVVDEPAVPGEEAPILGAPYRLPDSIDRHDPYSLDAAQAPRARSVRTTSAVNIITAGMERRRPTDRASARASRFRAGTGAPRSAAGPPRRAARPIGTRREARSARIRRGPRRRADRDS